MEDRSWADGMSQETFNVEWVKRFRRSDLIPDVITWVKPLTTAIEKLEEAKPFNPELLIRDIPGVKILDEKENEEIKKEKDAHLNAFYNCKYCNKAIKSTLGVSAHERHCKEAPPADPNSKQEIEKENNIKTLQICKYCTKSLKGKLNLVKHEKKCNKKSMIDG